MPQAVVVAPEIFQIAPQGSVSAAFELEIMSMRWGILTAALLLAGAAQAQSSVGGAVNDAGNMVGTAASSAVNSTASLVNANPKQVPPILEEALKRPYTLAGTATCAELTKTVTALNAVLGADVDQPVPPNSNSSSTELAMAAGQSAVGMFIPGTGLIRQLSGAAAAQRHAQAAVFAGSIRRAFLKGLGQARRCAPPAAPLPAALR